MNPLNKEEFTGPVQAQEKLVTPMQAQAWLNQFSIENNRNLIPRRVQSYLSLMKEGKWQVAQPIIFDENGLLIDGQHRLAAVVKFGRPVKFLVATGVSRFALSIIDTGAPRTAANIAKIQGTDIGSRHIACLLAMRLAPGVDDKATWPHIKKIEMVEQLRDAIFFACVGNGGGDKNRGVKASNSVINAVVARAYYYENHERLRQFLDVFRNGFPCSQDDFAAITLRNHYFDARKGSYREKGLTRPHLFVYAQTALRYFLQKKPLKSLRFPESPRNFWKVPLIDEDS